MGMLGIDPDETADHLDSKSEHAAADLMRRLAESRRELEAEIELLRTGTSELQTALVQSAIQLGRAEADRDADLPRLRANLDAWQARCRQAETDLRDATVRQREQEAVLEQRPDSAWWLAQYEGAKPALFATQEAARDYCDVLAKAEADGRCWDWYPTPDGDGVKQVWVRDLDDAPTWEAPGAVLRLTVQDRL